MRTRTVLLVMLGLSACLCWVIGTAIAEQPSAGAVVKAPDSSAGQTGKVVNKADTAKAGAQASQFSGIPQASPRGAGAPAIEYPAGYAPRSVEKKLADPSKLLPIPAGVERHQNYVPALTEGAGPRDAGVCLPEGGACGPIVFKNMESENFNYYTSGVGDIGIGDGGWLVGSERDVCQIIIPSYGGDGTYTYTMEIWTDCPAEGGAVKLYGPVNSGTLPSGYTETTYDIPGITVGTFVWINMVFTGVTATSAGPLINELPEIGFSEDIFGVIEGDPPECNYYWYGGGPVANPWAGLGFQISAAGSQNGKCCYNNCAACVDTTYGDCLALGGNPEFLLGTSCADAPGCAKGACCLTDGTCVADKTLAECEALPTYQANSWTLGTDCTAHGAVEQKFCAPVPTNDNCAAAITLTGTCATATFNNASATLDGFTTGDTYYTVSCLRGASAGVTDDDVQVANNIWYKWRVPTTYDGLGVTSGRVIISTLGTQFDTVLAVYCTYFNTDDCGTGDAIECADVGPDTELGDYGGCNDDIVAVDYELHDHMQLSYVEIEVASAGVVPPGACLLIMVGGLNQEGNPPGGPGQLNVDFIPTSSPWSSGSSGVCCTPTGCFIATTAGTGERECDFAAGEYLRPFTDFYENVESPDPPLPEPFEGFAGACCHGDAGSCVEGEFCGKAIDLGETVNGTLTWNGNVHRVTWFKFVPRDPVGDETEYSITIDTCGSGFDTVVSVYGPDLVNPSGECGDLLARNDNCTLSTVGAEGRVSCTGVATTTSCLCLGVNPIGDPMTFGETYYIGVGLKDGREIRGDGIDPVPNYPIDAAVPLSIKIIDTWTDCLACDKACCKADMDGDGLINGLDIQPFVNAVIGTAPPCRVDDPEDPQYKMWCRANMNGDAVVDLGDIPLFVNALLIPWDCDLTPYCEVEGYCQLPDADVGNGGIISDIKQNFKVADNFLSFTGGQITRVCWWGLYKFRSGSTWQACTYVPDDDFTITFYSSADNRPDAVLAQYSNIKLTGGDYTLSRTATGRNVVDVPEYKYEVTGLPPVSIPAGDCVWIEIVNNTSAGDCWWLWETQSNAGDGWGAAWEWNYYRWYSDIDLSFCVNIPIFDGGCPRDCLVPCPQGSILEGELDCDDESYVNINGGCYLGTPAFTALTSGNTYCGTTGIYPAEEPGFVTRDSDWYSLTITGGAQLSVGFSMDFNLLYYIINGTAGCSNWIDNIVEGWEIVPCATGVTIDTILPSAGTYWLLIIPDFDYGFDQPCGSEYSINVSWVAAATGACCNGTTCVATNTEYQCCSLSPNYVWYRGQNCGSFSCPTNNTLLWDNYPCTAAAPDGATASQKSTGTYVFNAQVADDFTFTTARTVRRARWIGAYYNGTGNTITGFRVYIYNNNVDRPTGAGLANPETTAIYNQLIPIANVTQIANAYGSNTQYEAVLPAVFNASANTKYWIVFQAELVAFPQWGICQSVTKIGTQARTGFPLLGTQFWNGALAGGANDMAFKLFGN